MATTVNPTGAPVLPGQNLNAGSTSGGTSPLNPNYNSQIQTGNAPAGTAISVDNLGKSSTNPPTTQSQPTPTDTTSHTASGNAQINGNTPSLTLPTPTADDTQPPSWIQKVLGNYPKPSSNMDTYNSMYNSSGINDLKTTANNDVGAYNQANDELNALYTKLSGINARANAQNLSLEQEAVKSGSVSSGFLSRQQQEVNRQAGIETLSHQTEVLGAQAKVAAALGKSNLSQSILQQAQDHLDKIFQIASSDASANYNYQTHVIDTYLNYADKAQTQALQARKDELATNNTQYNNFVNDIRSSAKDATASGQTTVSGKLANLVAKLDPLSKTFQADYKNAQTEYAKLQGQVVPKDSGNSTVTGYTSGSITGDVKDVLEGRNTMYNIRQTMGRTNKAAAYMEQMRNEIRKVDPSFDFVASDAGGKSVSTQYVQKATAAINAVLPNIDKIVNLSNDVNRFGVKYVDRILQAGNQQIGDKKVSNFHEAQKLIADEIGVALGAGSVSDMKLQLGFDVTDPSVTPEVFASNMAIVKDFINNRKAGLDSLRYKSSTVGGGQTVQSNGQTYTVGQVYNDGTANWAVDASGKWTKQ